MGRGGSRPSSAPQPGANSQRSAAAAVEPFSDVQKVAFVRGKSILDAVKIVAEHAVVV